MLLTALTHSLAISLAGHVRVNSISPGWIDTAGYQRDLPAKRAAKIAEALEADAA